MISIMIPLAALGISIFTLFYKEIGFYPNIERWPGSTAYPPNSSHKTMTIEFGVRNRRKHPVYVVAASLQFHGVRLKGVRNLVEVERLEFTLGAKGDLDIASLKEVKPGDVLTFVV